MAEWLRRQTWNLLGCARVGSNPAGVVSFSFLNQDFGASFSNPISPLIVEELAVLLN